MNFEQRWQQRTENPSLAGTIGWGVLLTGVVAWDIYSRETLSSAFDRYLEHPVKKWVAIGSVATVGAHLLNINEHFNIPDPIDYVASAVARRLT
jgi:hypothetical protein